jgi:hypothetical protein
MFFKHPLKLEVISTTMHRLGCIDPAVPRLVQRSPRPLASIEPRTARGAGKLSSKQGETKGLKAIKKMYNCT